MKKSALIAGAFGVVLLIPVAIAAWEVEPVCAVDSEDPKACGEEKILELVDYGFYWPGAESYGEFDPGEVKDCLQDGFPVVDGGLVHWISNPTKEECEDWSGGPEYAQGDCEDNCDAAYWDCRKTSSIAWCSEAWLICNDACTEIIELPDDTGL